MYYKRYYVEIKMEVFSEIQIWYSLSGLIHEDL